MKKVLSAALVFAAALMLAGCEQSDIKVTAASVEPEGIVVENPSLKSTEKTEAPTTAEYTIPEGATGPGDVVIEPDYSNLPEDKRPAETNHQIQCRYFYVNSKGLNEEFDLVEADTLTAENLTQFLIDMGVLAEGTTVVSYTVDGTDAVLELSSLKGQSLHATDEVMAQAVASTFIDNFNLDTVTVKAGGTSYGPLEYEDGKEK